MFMKTQLEAVNFTSTSRFIVVSSFLNRQTVFSFKKQIKRISLIIISFLANFCFKPHTVSKTKSKLFKLTCFGGVIRKTFRFLDFKQRQTKRKFTLAIERQPFPF